MNKAFLYKRLILVGLTLLLILGSSAAEDARVEQGTGGNQVPAVQGVGAETLVGVNYFAGWWKALPNKWHDRQGVDWRPDFPGRVPLLGEYNDQATTDREIVAAADHGIDFFAILWYPEKESKQDSRQVNRNLNRGLEFFMASPNSDRLKFFIEFCNHRPFGVSSDAEWERCTDVWVEAMKHPSYLRIGGRLVFKVHGSGQFLQNCGGEVEKCIAKLEVLRRKVRDANLGEMVIGGGALGVLTPERWGAKVFDFSCDYMSVMKLPKSEDDYPYRQQAEHVVQVRRERQQAAIPYMPFLCAGWNPRPWNDPRACFTLPTRTEWTQELRRMAGDLNASENLGIPLPDGTCQKVFTIYAWNEFGEGGIVAPTKGDGHMKLECIREVFGETHATGRK